MKDESLIVCPKCGVGSKNHEFCENCGSVFIRYADNNIDTSNLNSIILPGLTEELEKNLKAQQATHEIVNTAISVEDSDYTDGKNVFCNIVNTNRIGHPSGSFIFPEKEECGLAVAIYFCPFVDEKLNENFNKKEFSAHAKFKELPIYSLFKRNVEILESENGNEIRYFDYVIDCGEDIQGAANIISEIAIKVFNCNPSKPLTCNTLIGDENDSENNEPNETSQSSANDGFIVGAIAGGIISAIISTILWCVITCQIDYESGYYALGVGLIVGFSVRWVGRGERIAFGIIAAVCAVLSCIVSELYLSTIYYNIDIDIVSVIFWLVAAVEAYYCARNIKDDD